MSRRSLHIGYRDRLRNAGLGLNPASCEVMADGRPPPRCGDRFVAVHSGPRSVFDSRDSLDETYEVRVTVTQRIHAPWDRIGTEMEAIVNGFSLFCDRVRAALHNDTTPSVGLLAMMNAALLAELATDETTAGWSEPGYFKGDGPYQLVGPEHFHATSGKAGTHDYGIVNEMRFGDARRVQPLNAVRAIH